MLRAAGAAVVLAFGPESTPHKSVSFRARINSVLTRLFTGNDLYRAKTADHISAVRCDYGSARCSAITHYRAEFHFQYVVQFLIIFSAVLHTYIQLQPKTTHAHILITSSQMLNFARSDAQSLTFVAWFARVRAKRKLDSFFFGRSIRHTRYPSYCTLHFVV